MGVQYQKGFSSVDGNYGFGDGCFDGDTRRDRYLRDAVCARWLRVHGAARWPDYLVHVVMPNDAHTRLIPRALPAVQLHPGRRHQHRPR